MSEVKDAHHGGVKQYWVFCVILCVLTFFEWLIFEYRIPWGITNTVLVIGLSMLSIIKFVMVVGWYMHLKDDPPMLKNTFILSLLLILGIVAGLLALML